MQRGDVGVAAGCLQGHNYAAKVKDWAKGERKSKLLKKLVGKKM